MKAGDEIAWERAAEEAEIAVDGEAAVAIGGKKVTSGVAINDHGGFHDHPLMDPAGKI